jgi:hypothetical protein
MKEFVYSPIPEFNQETQYVKQSTPVDMGDYIFVGVEIYGLVQEEVTAE